MWSAREGNTALLLLPCNTHFFRASLAAYVSCRFGIHARPCLILVQLQRHYFKPEPIIVTRDADGYETLLSDVVGLMRLAAEPGAALQFLANMPDDRFAQFEKLIFLLSYVELQHGSVVKNDRTYEHVLHDIAECAGDHATLAARLRHELTLPDRQPTFSREPLPPQAHPPVWSHAFTIDNTVLAALEDIDPRLPPDLTRASSLIAQKDVVGLGVARKVCERLLNLIVRERGFAVPPRATLNDRIALLSDAGIITELDKQMLHFLRMLGNHSVHDSAIADKSLLPDAESAYHVHLMLQQLAKRLVWAISSNAARSIVGGPFRPTFTRVATE